MEAVGIAMITLVRVISLKELIAIRKLIYNKI